jgi:hypothetical protein
MAPDLAGLAVEYTDPDGQTFPVAQVKVGHFQRFSHDKVLIQNGPMQR